MVEEITEEELVEAYARLHYGKTGETLKSNAERLYEWLKDNGYILTEES